MKPSAFQNRTSRTAVLLVLGSMLAGCVTTQRTPPAVPLQEHTAFQTSAGKADVTDAAAAALVANNFNLSLANERIGLLQTDYVPLSMLRTADARSAEDVARLEPLMMKVTVNTEERGGVQYVQVKGTLQRVRGEGGADSIIGRYWLDRVTRDIADELGAKYTPGVSETAYVEALQGSAAPRSTSAKVRSHSAVRAVAIVAAVLFIVTLTAGSMGPGSY